MTDEIGGHAVANTHNLVIIFFLPNGWHSLHFESLPIKGFVLSSEWRFTLLDKCGVDLVL